MPDQAQNRNQALVQFVYGEEQAAAVYPRLDHLLEEFKHRHRARAALSSFVTERDVVLITYGDMVTQPDQAPLATLRDFLQGQVEGLINSIHILPFFPYSSDDGFSVIDYREVNPALGRWEDVKRLGQSFRLMVDLVLNHMSAQSRWFQAFRRNETPYRDYFITSDPAHDLSLVMRPRTHPLLTPVETAQGIRYVWTTFSADQVDLNFANPEVLLEMIDILLFYIEQGASLIRLDAIAYLWKEAGTSCIHLAPTHAVVQLLRAIVDEAGPGVLLITETNVPHEENISYFGNGTNEAHLVYQFALPPLIAHTLLSGSADRLRRWAKSLDTPSKTTTFFNFTASHDGIGMRPAAGILTPDEIDRLIERTLENGGRVSYKTNADGSQSPYELNIVYYSLLNPPAAQEPQALQVQRFLCSQAIMVALAGVPGIYFHSLVGSENDVQGMQHTGHARAINREKLDRASLEREVGDPGSRRHAILEGYKKLLRQRIGEPAFHPNGTQRILASGDAVFGLVRESPSGEQAIIALHNVTAARQEIALNLRDLDLGTTTSLHDLVADQPIRFEADGSLRLELQPYDIAWLHAELA